MKMVFGETSNIATGEIDYTVDVQLPLVPYEHIEMMEVLGAGGFGSVHYGMCADHQVAVKRTHQRHKQVDSQFTESFMAEIRASTLHHEHIVRVLGICSDHPFLDELPLLIMEYAGGRNLQTLVEDQREIIDTPRRLRFATDIASALEFAHSHGILHLDVKLLNIIVDSEDNCKLADFGCSRTSPDRKPDTPTKSLMTGTFAYRAPELLRGKQATDRSDVYSLAICLWQLLARERPYDQEEHQVIVFAVVAFNQRPAVPTTIEGSIDQLYCELLQRAWSADPLQRPSAKELHQTLRLLQQDPVG